MNYREEAGSYHITNDTMKLLRHQNIEFLFDNKEIEKQMLDIKRARQERFSFCTAIDIFLLGYIHGKRAERARRKRTGIILP